MSFGHSVFPRTIILKHIIHFQYYFKFEIWLWCCWWMKHCCFEEVNCLFQCSLFGHLVLFNESYWQIFDQNNDRYNPDLRVTHHFWICSWVFPLGFIENNVFVDCGNFSGDCRSIHGMRSDFRCSEDKVGLFEIIADRFMEAEVIIFRWLYLISLIIFSNVSSGSNFSTSILLFILICYKFSSNKVIDDIFMSM